MRRLLALMLAIAMLSGCTNRLGRRMPECDSDLSTSSVLQVQALPDAAFVPCIDSLPLGWEYNHLRAQSGLSEFTLDSDRMGDDFAVIRATSTCDLGNAREIASPRPDMRVFTTVTADLAVPLVIVPEGLMTATANAAQSIAIDLIGTRVNDKRIDLVIDRSDVPTHDRIATARSEGANVLVVGLREAEQGTVTLILAGQTAEQALTLEHALDALARSTPDPTIRGSWFHVFEGGCIEYRFDAEGPETHTLEHDIRDSLGFIDANEVREVGRSLGYDI